MPPIEDLLKEQGQKSAKQYNNIKNWVRATWIFMIVATACLTTAIVLLVQSNNEQNRIIANQADSIEQLSNVLDRRSPVLEYMYCIDSNQAMVNEAAAKRDRAQTAFVLESFRIGNDPTAEELALVQKLEKEYLDSEVLQTELSRPNAAECPDAPS